jgi:penicillin-binding protein 2
VNNPPAPGDNLKLSIDSKVQEAGEAAMAARGLPGGFVTMNVDNGEIIALGSYPTYDPSELIEPSQAQVNALYRSESAPVVDRATQGLYPTGSTFKLITATAALEEGVLTPSTTIVDGGTFVAGSETFQNAGGASYGALTLVPALQVSSDVFFYTLGAEMWNTNDLQHWAHKMGIGRPSGLDLPEQTEGLLPTRHWRDKLFKEGETERPWSEGDNIQLATGQGDLQTNPLQMAIAYATLANGGTVVTPHVGYEVEDAAGRVVKEFTPKPQRHVHIKPETREVILEGLHEAAQAPGGTSYEIFGNFPVPVAGKTGTAQRPPHLDQSWYGVLAPYPNPRIVTFVTMEEGGFGAESAAPAARQILEAYFGKHGGEVGSGAGGIE